MATFRVNVHLKDGSTKVVSAPAFEGAIDDFLDLHVDSGEYVEIRSSYDAGVASIASFPRENVLYWDTNIATVA